MKEPEENWDFNPDKKKRIAYLVAGFLEKTLTSEEETELDDWINASDQNQRIFDDLIDPDKLKQGFKELDNLDVQAAWQRIEQRKAEVKPIRLKWPKYAAAAAIILLIGLSIFYLITSNKNTDEKNIANVQGDIMPGSNKATLTLADGSTIALNEIPNGTVNAEKSTGIKKIKEGELEYDASTTSAIAYNTLTTPRGGQYTVNLPDGSKVILNAASSLKYPLRFTGKNREVELTGEAYFEISKDKTKPFMVKTPNQQVEVLGTHFNINAYEDEIKTHTTLVEGSVKISASGNQKILSPGYQSILDENKLLTIRQADLLEVTAWKEGNFEFVNAPIETIMKQVTRWYDAEIIYEGNVPFHFNASISRNVPVSKLLKLLASTGRVHFKITGNKIFVTP